MSRRWAARLAAPAAFLAGVTAAVVLVRSGLAEEESEPPARRVTVVQLPTATTRPAPKPVYATVESGGTLAQLALEHDTTVERLLELNPDLDPTALQVGQRVRVR